MPKPHQYTGKHVLFTLAISFIISWYLVAEDTSPACSNVRRFLWIFLFFCSIGSCPSSKIDWLCFIFSGVLESKMARFSTSFKCSDSCIKNTQHKQNPPQRTNPNQLFSNQYSSTLNSQRRLSRIKVQALFMSSYHMVWKFSIYCAFWHTLSN